MLIDRTKLKKFWGYFALGIACIICAIIYLFDVGNDKTKNDFAQLEVHIAKPIEYRKGYKGSRPYVIIKIKEYPLFQFSKNQREIKYLHEFKKNIFTGDATKQGDSISLTIYEKDAKFIREKDITKFNIPEYWANESIEIIGLSHNGIQYVEFNIDDFNVKENSSRKSTFYFFCILGVVCILVGRYRWKKNKRW